MSCPGFDRTRAVVAEYRIGTG